MRLFFIFPICMCILAVTPAGADTFASARQALEQGFVKSSSSYSGTNIFTLADDGATRLKLRIIESGDSYDLEWRFETDAAPFLRGINSEFQGLSISVDNQLDFFWEPSFADIAREAEIALNVAMDQSFGAEPIADWRRPNRKQLDILKRLAAGVNVSYNLGYRLSSGDKSASYSVPLGQLDEIHRALSVYSALCRCNFRVPQASNRQLAIEVQRQEQAAIREQERAEQAALIEQERLEIAAQREEQAAIREQELELARIEAEQEIEVARIQAEQELERERRIMERQREMAAEAAQRRAEAEERRRESREEVDDDW